MTNDPDMVDSENLNCHPSSKTTNSMPSDFFPQLFGVSGVASSMNLQEFCAAMARLEISNCEEYEAWWSEVGRWNDFPKHPVDQFKLHDLWREVGITRGHLRLLNALAQPLSSFE